MDDEIKKKVMELIFTKWWLFDVVILIILENSWTIVQFQVNYWL